MARKQLLYTIIPDKHFGFLMQVYLVTIDQDGKRDQDYKSLSTKNSQDYDAFDATDKKLMLLIEQMDPNQFYKKIKDKDTKSIQLFLTKYYLWGKNDPTLEPVRTYLSNYLDMLRHQFMELVQHKPLYLFIDKNPQTWLPLRFAPNKITTQFSFTKNELGLRYVLKAYDNKTPLRLKDPQTYVLNNEPAILLHNKILYYVENKIKGNKIKPFLVKETIAIQKEREKEYFEKFIVKTLISEDIEAHGFIVSYSHPIPTVVLDIQEEVIPVQQDLFQMAQDTVPTERMVITLYFKYDPFSFKAGLKDQTVKLEYHPEHPVCYKVKRNDPVEKEIIQWLSQKGLLFLGEKILWTKSKALAWLVKHQKALEDKNILIRQPQGHAKGGKKYFIGKSSFEVAVSEQKDWFEIKTKVLFGPYQIPFYDIYKRIIAGKKEFKLPNGDMALIPEQWIEHYAGLIDFMIPQETGQMILSKHHVGLVKEMEQAQLIALDLNKRLEKLVDNSQIDDYPIPQNFKGALRPYQKAGYNWMRFLNEFQLGGCLADDMGLGKTIQTLALLQQVQENENQFASLLIVPKSLIFNWQAEAKKFAPQLRIMVHAGNQRSKTNAAFAGYDLVITTYPILFRDSHLFDSFYFNYIILDEAQAIKNPASAITKAVMSLRSKNKLTLTGTPIENTTADIWSQIHFLNPGLLGTLPYFKKEYLLPIEKAGNQKKAQKLQTIISPFILRRLKTQVATELPEKTINIHYVEMTEQQEERYEKLKAQYRKIMFEGLEQPKPEHQYLVLMQGLMKLRQLANHPLLEDSEYQGDSGKFEEIKNKLETITVQGNKVLVFSSFVKHLNIIKTYLDGQNSAYAYIDGQTKNREQQVHAFQNDPAVKIFLISLKAGGTGLNLTQAEYVFLIDPWWNPAAEAQAIDRAHRIGQKNQVFVYKFITKNTVEEKILRLQQSKKELSDALIATDSDFNKHLDKEALKSLLT